MATFQHLVQAGKTAKSGQDFKFFDLAKLGPEFHRLPFSIRIVLESAVRNCDNFQVLEEDVAKILAWEQHQGSVEIPFRPARVILQDFTGVPAIVDFAAMRDAVAGLGGDPDRVNPKCPADLVIDHSVQVDFARSSGARAKNEALELERNKERFTFLKWGASAFDNMLIVPPGSGIVHQVNLEYLARVCFTNGDIVYPDSVVGTGNSNLKSLF